jgi:alkanesulfonate monooxygenase SsuD/methylene tetrahydromethanopterin reductase-like flavin-dependent oxidoreductase (luciferase family)
MSVSFGLFDNLQIDPADPRPAQEIFAQRLDDLAYAESVGLWGAFTAERHFWRLYRSVAPTAWVAAASQRTTTLRLGVLAYTLPLHEPARLAEEIAALDILSNGRLEVGLGLGHRPAELEQTGVDPQRRVPLFQERFAVLQGLLSGGTATVNTEYHQLKEISAGLLPVQQPYPPLWFAGTEPNAVSWAGINGLDLAVGFAPNKALFPSVAAFRSARATAAQQRDPGAEPLRGGRVALMRHLYIAESDELAHQEMVDDLYRLNSVDPRVREGSRPNRREDAEAEAKRLVDEEVVLAGGIDFVAAKLSFARTALGFDLFLGNVYPAGVEQERIRRTMRLLATQIAPVLNESKTAV